MKARRQDSKVKDVALRRRWSITTKVEENFKCDVTIKVNVARALLSHLNVLSSAYDFMLAAFNSSFVSCDPSKSAEI